jgi:transcriptional regulator with XRE-family HTH domain
MPSSLKQFRENALARPDVRAAYVKQQEEFSFLDEILRARAAAGLTQAEVAAKIGTTQSAVARLESSTTGHSPSVSTLRKYASALGCRVEIRLVANAASQRKRVVASTKPASSKA